MPKVSEEHRAARRAEIIDAAVRVVMRKGYARSSMADIISESGLSAGAIYGYFPGKQEIVRAVAEQVLGRRVAEVDTLTADHVPAPSEVLETIIRGIASEPFNAVVVQLWAEAASDPSLRQSIQQVFQKVHATLAGAIVAWGEANPHLLPAEPEAWAPRVSMVLASLGPGFMLFNTLIDDFDADLYLDSIHLALGLEA